MSKVRIYRLETTEGIGVYMSDAWEHATCTDSTCSDRHPSPLLDPALQKFQDEDYFGFASIAQYRAWVYKAAWRRALFDEGIELVVYEVERQLVTFGEVQCVFMRSKANVIERLHPAYREMGVKLNVTRNSVRM